ncbi:MAG: hypothetical protein L0206_14980 [Actinobacteria bacterium]|nr:hypothetical protein [Actinomycetota bacterium]
MTRPGGDSVNVGSEYQTLVAVEYLARLDLGQDDLVSVEMERGADIEDLRVTRERGPEIVQVKSSPKPITPKRFKPIWSAWLEEARRDPKAQFVLVTPGSAPWLLELVETARAERNGSPSPDAARGHRVLMEAADDDEDLVRRVLGAVEVRHSNGDAPTLKRRILEDRLAWYPDPRAAFGVLSDLARYDARRRALFRKDIEKARSDAGVAGPVESPARDARARLIDHTNSNLAVAPRPIQPDQPLRQSFTHELLERLALNAPVRVALLAESGEGKSVHLALVARRLLDSARTVLLVAADRDPLESFQADVAAAATEDRVFVLVDRAEAAAGDTAFRRALVALRARTNVSLIVAGRPGALESLDEVLPEARLALPPLTDAEVHTVEQKLAGRDLELARTPLHLKIMLDVGAGSATTRANLFDRLWESKVGRSAALARAVFVAAGLAWKQRRNEFDPYAPEVGEHLAELADLGLIRYERGGRRAELFHDSFLEYVLARELLRDPSRFDEVLVQGRLDAAAIARFALEIEDERTVLDRLLAGGVTRLDLRLVAARFLAERGPSNPADHRLLKERIAPERALVEVFLDHATPGWASEIRDLWANAEPNSQTIRFGVVAAWWRWLSQGRVETVPDLVDAWNYAVTDRNQAVWLLKNIAATREHDPVDPRFGPLARVAIAHSDLAVRQAAAELAQKLEQTELSVEILRHAYVPEREGGQIGDRLFETACEGLAAASKQAPELVLDVWIDWLERAIREHRAYTRAIWRTASGVDEPEVSEDDSSATDLRENNSDIWLHSGDIPHDVDRCERIALELGALLKDLSRTGHPAFEELAARASHSRLGVVAALVLEAYAASPDRTAKLVDLLASPDSTAVSDMAPAVRAALSARSDAFRADARARLEAAWSARAGIDDLPGHRAREYLKELRGDESSLEGRRPRLGLAPIVGRDSVSTFMGLDKRPMEDVLRRGSYSTNVPHAIVIRDAGRNRPDQLLQALRGPLVGADPAKIAAAIDALDVPEDGMAILEVCEQHIGAEEVEVRRAVARLSSRSIARARASSEARTLSLIHRLWEDPDPNGSVPLNVPEDRDDDLALAMATRAARTVRGRALEAARGWLDEHREDERVLALLQRAVSDPSPDVRVLVAHQLACVRDPRRYVELGDQLARDPEPVVALEGLEALGGVIKYASAWVSVREILLAAARRANPVGARARAKLAEGWAGGWQDIGPEHFLAAGDPETDVELADLARRCLPSKSPEVVTRGLELACKLLPARDPAVSHDIVRGLYEADVETVHVVSVVKSMFAGAVEGLARTLAIEILTERAAELESSEAAWALEMLRGSPIGSSHPADSEHVLHHGAFKLFESIYDRREHLGPEVARLLPQVLNRFLETGHWEARRFLDRISGQSA